jgi:hypothetical protein
MVRPALPDGDCIRFGLLSMPSYPLVLCLTIAVVCSVGMAVAAWPRRDDPTVRAFLVLAAGVAIWSGGRLLEISETALAGRIFWASSSMPASWPCPSAGWWRWSTSAGRASWCPGRCCGCPCFAVLTLALVFTNERHHLIWTSIELMPPGVSPGAVFRHGIGYTVAAWTYALLGLSMYFLATAEVPNAALSARGRNVLMGRPVAAAGDAYRLPVSLDRPARAAISRRPRSR